MMRPYARFLVDFDRGYRDMIHHNCPENTRAALIVETRADPFLPMVIRNVMHFLGPRWNLYVVTGDPSYQMLCGELSGWGVPLARLAPGTWRISIEDYNELMTSPGLWQQFHENQVLVFQADALLTGPNIDDFLGYDFIGAPAGQLDEEYIVNGGLSLRSTRLMVDCVARGGQRPPGMLEDIYFTNQVRAMGVPMPNFATAARFSVESVYRGHPVGVHGTNKNYHPIEVAERIVRGVFREPPCLVPA